VGRVRVGVVRGPHADDVNRWYWRARISEDGNMRTVWTGWGTVSEVQVAVAGFVATGERERPTGDRAETVRDLLEFWAGSVEDRKDISERSRTLYKRAAGHLARLIGEMQIERLDVGVLATYRDLRLAEIEAGSTVFEEIKIARRAYRWGQDLGLIVDQRRLGSPRVNRQALRAKETPTADDFWRVVDELPQPWHRTMAVLLGATGARQGEIAQLHWEHVDLNNGTIRIRGKGRRWRDVVVAEDLIDYLRPSFPDGGRGSVLGVTQQTATSNFGQALRELDWDALGIRRFTSHGFRRMVVARYYTSGADIGVVAAQLGQSPEIALKYYREATREQKVRAVALASLGARPEQPKILKLPPKKET
jgi:integrase